VSRYDLRVEELAELLAGEPAFRVRQVWDGLYRQLAEPEALTTLPSALRSRLSNDERLKSALVVAEEVRSDRGATAKWLFRLRDGAVVETVLLRYPDRATVCVSSQAGCAMGCAFCATGQGGFRRHLSTGEIVEQVVHASRAARQEGFRLDHVVFMGMGEPLANYDSVLRSARVIVKDLGIAARHVTISTVGVVPGIVRLAAEPLQVNLAVSLHGANDELRSQLVPLNRRYPIETLIAACSRYVESTRRRVSFEWALIAGVNDRPSDATELAALARRVGAHVNVIPLNPTPGYLALGSSPKVVRAFRDELLRRGVNVTIRATRGQEIAGACGQLAGACPAGAP
jgi:23S rRNA (adenine2503-C2)-methyltransferase